MLTALAVLPAMTASIPSALAQTPSPIITVDAHTDNLWGDHWPALASVTVTIGSETWSTTANDSGNFYLELAPFDLHAGNTVTALDGTTIKDHTVLSLAITNVDHVSNVVTGTADAGTDVWVDVHGQPDVKVARQVVKRLQIK